MKPKKYSKKELRECIRKMIREQIEKTDSETHITVEGINIDAGNKIVSFDDSHEENVDTSNIINPTYHTVNGYPVISIFKRKANEEKSDGNPLIYALKGILNWKIDKTSIIELLKKFIRISEKIKPEYDTIVVVESSNTLNTKFLHRLNKIIRAKNVITDLFYKIPASEILTANFDGRSMPKEDAEFVHKKLRRMIKNNNIFSFKFIPKELRYCIKKTIGMYPPETELIKYSKLINDKNVLVLDDTISSGTTISEYCKNLIDTFTPKSLTVITLFSPI